MTRAHEEWWNVEYLSGVTNKVLDIVSVASIHLVGKRAEIPQPPGKHITTELQTMTDKLPQEEKPCGVPCLITLFYKNRSGCKNRLTKVFWVLLRCDRKPNRLQNWNRFCENYKNWEVVYKSDVILDSFRCSFWFGARCMFCSVLAQLLCQQASPPHFQNQGWPFPLISPSFKASNPLTSKEMIYVTMMEQFLCFEYAKKAPY